MATESFEIENANTDGSDLYIHHTGTKQTTVIGPATKQKYHVRGSETVIVGSDPESAPKNITDRRVNIHHTGGDKGLTSDKRHANNPESSSKSTIRPGKDDFEYFQNPDKEVHITQAFARWMDATLPPSSMTHSSDYLTSSPP